MRAKLDTNSLQSQITLIVVITIYFRISERGVGIKPLTNVLDENL
jgi:hypothetical protein